MIARVGPPRKPKKSGGAAVAVVLAVAVTVGLGCRDDTDSPAGPEPAGTALVTASASQALAFRQVSVGTEHSCGVTTDNRAYCWGNNVFGRLGDGTQGPSPSHSSLVPVPVAGGLRFQDVRAGDNHTCGITTDVRAYCWGYNNDGQLGDGTTSMRLTPVAVAGGRRFRQVSPGSHHTCAVTPSDVAFCWGSGEFGRMGDGTFGSTSTVPVRVLGGVHFRQVIAAYSHTCGAATDFRAYCWGNNTFGQLGDGTKTSRPKPVAVAGGLSFRQVLPGAGFILNFGEPVPDDGHTCGVTTEDRVYCWGHNGFGELGDGTTTLRLTPTVVAGGRRYRFVSPGGGFTCAVTLTDVPFCWGTNTSGQLGTGGASSSSPVRVAGGLAVRSVSASVLLRHACGATTDNRAYCWGLNSNGQLGDGTTTSRPTPVAVAPPS